MTLDERISRYLTKCPPAVSGQDGHGTTFKVACALVNGFALEPDTALRWMRVYNAACMPPWKSRELRHKVEQAAKKPHGKPRGHLLGDERNGAVKAAQPVAESVPVRLQPRESRFRTVRTVFSEPYVKACAHTCVRGIGKQSSVPSGGKILAGSDASTGEPVDLPGIGSIGIPMDPRVSVEPTPLDWTALNAAFPPTTADETWRAVEAAGFGDEPLIALAFDIFGPGCRVISAGEAARV